MSHGRIDSKFICVWLDKQHIRSEDYVNAQSQLRNVVNSFRGFHNTHQCVDFIINNQNAKILLITSDEFAHIIMPVIYSCEQIHSIYVFNSNKSANDKWTKDYEKIKGFYNDMKLICDQIKESISQSGNDIVSISFVSSADVTSNDVNRQDPSFMYFQLLKEIILNDHQNETEKQTKNDMLTFCRNECAGSRNSLKILDKFENEFNPERSIYWYTRECFLYRMLNKALWTPQPDVLYKLRYFVRHLHQQILFQASLQRDHLSSVIVYRGQSMSEDQIEKLKQNVGGFLSFNNFLSTSLKRDVALNFLWGSEVGVLFEIHIDPTIQKFPFANIEQLSYQQGENGECELLFSMGSVFRILHIDKQKDFYRVQLTLSDDIDEQLAEYTKLTREETRSSHSFLSLLKLMHELAQYSSVDQFAEIFGDGGSLAVSPIVLGSIHHAFGLIYLERGQSEKALDHFRKTLSIYLDFLPADHPKLSPTYSNIGFVHSTQSDYETALTFHQLALDCQLNAKNPDISSIVAYRNNIASIYYQQEKYDEAIEHHKRALELQKQYLGENDPSLTNTYNVISAICYKHGDYEQATLYHEKAVALQEDTSRSDPSASANCSLTTGSICLSQGQYQEASNHFNRALKIQQQYFLPNNPLLSTTYNCIANTYYKQNQFEEALSYHYKALENEESSLSNDHPSIAVSYSNIAKDYAGLLCWSLALEFGLKAIEQVNKSPQADPSNLVSYTQHVAHIYHQQKNYQEALNYFHRALEIQQQYFSPNHPSLVSTYDRIASICYKQDQIEKALIYYKKALEIERRSLSDNHTSVSARYFNISKAYADLLRWSDALEYSLKAVEQMKKLSQTDIPAVAALVQYVGHIYHQQNEYEQALIYYKEALELYGAHLREDDDSLNGLYHRTASIYYKLKKYKEALLFYQKALNIELKTVPNNAKTIADTYSNISTAYFGMNQLDQAFIAANQALAQLCKTLPNNHPDVVQQRAYLDAIKIKQILEDTNH
ncbi:unnamed protein product [Rotaria sp. Silwood1]|nr:unnamed protein product [Rotaria sp. Silwood1]